MKDKYKRKILKKRFIPFPLSTSFLDELSITQTMIMGGMLHQYYSDDKYRKQVIEILKRFKLKDKYLGNFKYKINWKQICKYQDLSLAYVKKYKKYIYWKVLLKNYSGNKEELKKIESYYILNKLNNDINDEPNDEDEYIIKSLLKTVENFKVGRY
jgi:hypothetical protein